ncbi:hypothetical protein QJS10_CPB21g01076 [Acorus calamus]|uniref:Uncharacterized protein n=1 Tax=Acorus calamus TaxID=4465 RepID=A0AAV9C5Z1_ACOCL|nr:hypothetical protein QJS10_CPB21g01076 [Acorus calamus]
MRGAAKDNKPEDHAAMEACEVEALTKVTKEVDSILDDILNIPTQEGKAEEEESDKEKTVDEKKRKRTVTLRKGPLTRSAAVGLSKPMTDVGETIGPKTRGRLLSQQLQAKKPQEKRLLTKPNMPKTYKHAAKEKHVQLSEDEQVALACHLSKMESEELQPVYREVTDVLRQNYPGKQRCTPKEIALIDKFLENPLMDDSPAWEVPDDGSTVHTMVTRKHLFEVILNQWLGEEVIDAFSRLMAMTTANRRV